jgi:peptidoglycan/LPS O-acetylase OafA/YrhL
MKLAIAALLVGVGYLGWRAPSYRDRLMATVGFTWLALTYLAILLYALLFRNSWVSHCLRWGWLRGMGIIAYGTYLFHEYFWGMFFGRVPWVYSWRDAGLSVIVLMVTIVFCRLSWVYFEKPLIKIGHRASYEFGGARLARTAPAPAEGG